MPAVTPVVVKSLEVIVAVAISPPVMEPSRICGEPTAPVDIWPDPTELKVAKLPSPVMAVALCAHYASTLRRLIEGRLSLWLFDLNFLAGRNRAEQKFFFACRRTTANFKSDMGKSLSRSSPHLED